MFAVLVQQACSKNKYRGGLADQWYVVADAMKRLVFHMNIK